MDPLFVALLFLLLRGLLWARLLFTIRLLLLLLLLLLLWPTTTMLLVERAFLYIIPLLGGTALLGEDGVVGGW
jgi:hypothetical protein